MLGITNKGGGDSLGTAIKGSKKKYYAYAGQDIKKGDFVRYLTGVSGVGAGTAIWRDLGLVSSSHDSYIYSRAVQVDANKILALYTDRSGYIVANVVTIDGVEFSAGPAITLPSAFKTGMWFDAFKIDSGRILLATVGTSNGWYIWASVISISGNTCSAGTVLQTQFSSNTSVINGLKATQKLQIAGNVAHLIFEESGSSTVTLYSARMQISGTTVTMDSLPYEGLISLGQRGSSNNQYDYTILKDSSKLVAVSTMGDSSSSTGYVVQLSTSIGVRSTYVTTYSIPWNGGFNQNFRILPVSGNQAFIMGRPGIATDDLTRWSAMGLLVNASNTLTLSNPRLDIYSGGKALPEATYNTNITLGESRMMFTYIIQDAQQVTCRVVTMNGATPSLGTALNISMPIANYYASGYFSLSSVCQLVGGKVYISAQSSVNGVGYPMHGMILNAPSNTVETINYLYETQVRKALNNDEIQGISVEDAKGGTLTGANAAHNQACDIISVTSP